MADTLQYVGWHVQQACPFRQGEAVTGSVPAWNATWRLRAIDDAKSRNDVFGDICVTGHSYYQGLTTPHGGFRISQAVAAAGDLGDARGACQGCPANGYGPAGGRMAGCCGYLPVNPEDQAVEATLGAAVGCDDLGGSFASAFPKTKPTWYGLWMSSPLSVDQMQILLRVLPQIERQREALDLFCRACASAMEHGLAVHVSMPPPGHTDLGAYWTWPHCPRCKKRTASRSTAPATCASCGHRYVPAETTSMEEDEYSPGELEGLMSPEEYRALCVEWRERHPEELIENWRAEKGAGSKWRGILGRLWRGLTG